MDQTNMEQNSTGFQPQPMNDSDTSKGHDHEGNEQETDSKNDSHLLSIVQSTSSTGDIIYDYDDNRNSIDIDDGPETITGALTSSFTTINPFSKRIHSSESASASGNIDEIGQIGQQQNPMNDSSDEEALSADVSKPSLYRSDSALQDIVKAAGNPFFHAIMSESDAHPDPDPLPSQFSQPHSNQSLHPQLQPPNHIIDGDDSESSIASAANSYFSNHSSSQHSSQQTTNSNQNSSSQSYSSSSTRSSNQIYQLTDSNTGKSYDIRNLEMHGSDEACFQGIGVSKLSLFPTEGDLRQSMPKSNHDTNDIITSSQENEKSHKFSPGKAVAQIITKPFARIGARSRKVIEENDNDDIFEVNGFSEGLSSSCQDNESVSIASSAYSQSVHRSESEGPSHSLRTHVPEVEEESEVGEKKLKQAHKQLPSSTNRKFKVIGKADTVADIDANSAKTDGPREARKEKKRREKKLKPHPIPEPKNTIKCNKKYKKQESDFHPLLLISTIERAHDGPIWCVAFSKSGKYLATGGRDGVVQIWELAPKKSATSSLIRNSKDDRLEQEERDDVGGDIPTAADAKATSAKSSSPHSQNYSKYCDALGTDIIVINPNPIQRFEKHEKDVVNLSWSNTDFLISASLDKTARLWHPSRHICLSIFKHPDAVTAVAFHPKEDKYFVSGGFDKKLRIWNIPNGRVAAWNQAPEVITSVTYLPDSKSIAAGLFNGKVYFYALANSSNGDKVKLTYHTQITTKPKGKKQGKKVTGLTFLRNLSDDKVADHGNNGNSPKGNKRKGRIQAVVQSLRSPGKKKKVKDQLLITTNDSRLRLVGMKDFCMVRKYKGHANTSLQIEAHFSESGEFIISGSELRGSCAIWNTATKRNPLNVNVTGLNMYDKVKAHEWFEATTADPAIVTDATFAPSSTVKEAILSSGLFPTLYSLNQINHDFSSSVIIACDYEGTMRVFLRKSCIDSVSHAAGPGGFASV